MSKVIKHLLSLPFQHFIMNWKLLLIALSLIVGVSARAAPTERVEVSESSTATPEASTLLTEKPTSATTSTLAPTTVTDAPSTVRYFMASLQPTKRTNAHHKYANNYANLITKYTLNNNRIMGNVSSNNSNMFVTLHGVVVASSLPDASLASSASNSSSRPLVFVDADNVNPTITTKRAFVPLKENNGGSWANYNVEVPKVVTTRPKRPIIHKIISKWSDNPNVVFNLHGDESLITTQASQINELTDQLVQNAFRPGLFTSTSFDQLPAILGQLYLTTTVRPPTVTNKAKKPSTKNNCKRVKIKFGNSQKNVNEFGSKENCNDINIEIDNKIENINTIATTNDYETLNNDKFEDSTNGGYDSSEKQQEDSVEVVTDSPQIVHSIAQIARPGNNKGTSEGSSKHKKKKRKKPSGAASASQIDDDGGDEDGGDDSGTDMGSMMMTMVTMMAVFNPLNFGVWGVVLAPMAAMMFGGICFAMYHFKNNQKQPLWPSHPPWALDPWPKPQEIIIRNKIKHSPIPIKVMHLHKSAPPPSKIYFSEPMESHGPPLMPYSPPHHSNPPKSYGEPPVDSYHPSAPSGGPYRKSQEHFRRPRPTKNSYKFKLL